jgi:hypothetical protein
MEECTRVAGDGGRPQLVDSMPMDLVALGLVLRRPYTVAATQMNELYHQPSQEIGGM